MLGGFNFRILTSEDDMNNLRGNLGFIVSSGSSIPLNLPTDATYMGIVLRISQTGRDSLQIAYARNVTTNATIYIRKCYGNNWSKWSTISMIEMTT